MRRPLILAALLVILGILALVAVGVANFLARLEVPEFWRDFGSFLSLFLTTLGLGYTVYQVTLIETAARAAERAAHEARQESRRRLLQFTAASVHRLITMADNDLAHSEWGKAAIRLDDLADQSAQIGGHVEEWRELIQGLREAAGGCRDLETKRKMRPFLEKWYRLLRNLRTRLDSHIGPLQSEIFEVEP